MQKKGSEKKLINFYCTYMLIASQLGTKWLYPYKNKLRM